MLAPEHDRDSLPAACAMSSASSCWLVRPQSITGPSEQPRFHVVYSAATRSKHNLSLGLRVPLDGNVLTVPTIEKRVSQRQLVRARDCGICSASVLKVIPTCAAS